MGCSSLRDVSISPGHRTLRTLATQKLYQQALEHFLTFVAKRSLPILEDTQIDTALTIYSNAQYMFGVLHHRGNTLTAAIMHRYPRYSRHEGGKLPRFHRCLRGWKLLTPRRTRKAFPLNVSTDLFIDTIVVPLHFATRRWTMHETKPILRMSPSTWSGSGATGWRRSCPFLHTEDKDAHVCLIPTTSSGHIFRKRVNPSTFKTSLCTMLDSSIDRRPLNECKSRGQWRTDQSAQRARLAAEYLALPRRTRVPIETFASLAERAILGTSQGSACTGVRRASTFVASRI